LVKAAITRKAKGIWLIGSVLRVLRHGVDVRWVSELLINLTDKIGDCEKLR